MVVASFNAGTRAITRTFTTRASRSMAGSTSTDAITSVTTLTADTTPIDRNGGYEEVTRVP